MVALRDRANLSLGLMQLRMELPQSAIDNLSRVRLKGPLSNDALLASGWAWYQLNKFKQAQKVGKLTPKNPKLPEYKHNP